MNKVAKTTKGAAKARRQTQAEHSGAGPVHPLLHLQQAVGNRALSELLDGKVQRQEGPEEEDLLQAKPEVQMQPEEEKGGIGTILGNLAGNIGGSLKGLIPKPQPEVKWKNIPQVYSDKARKGYGPNPATGGIPLPFDPARDKEIGGPKKPTMVGPEWQDVRPKPKGKPKLGKTNKLKFEEF